MAPTPEIAQGFLPLSESHPGASTILKSADNNIMTADEEGLLGSLSLVPDPGLKFTSESGFLGSLCASKCPASSMETVQSVPI